MLANPGPPHAFSWEDDMRRRRTGSEDVQRATATRKTKNNGEGFPLSASRLWRLMLQLPREQRREPATRLGMP